MSAATNRDDVTSGAANKDDIAIVARLLEGAGTEVRLKVFNVIAKHSLGIVEVFFQDVRAIPEIAEFFCHGVVEDRLSWVMRLWLTELFFNPRDSSDVHGLIQRQVEVGQRHALVNAPLSLMHVAVGELKRGLFKSLINDIPDPHHLTDAIIFVSGMVDWAIGIINRVYMRDVLADVRDQQSLKLQIFNVDMALQTESLRVSLYDWHRQILRLLYDESIGLDRLPTLRRTNLGLWVLHKGDLMLPDTAELEQLKYIIDQVDKSVQQAAMGRQAKSQHELRSTLTAIDQYVDSASSILGNISDRMLTLEGGRDPLTKLFNRRFLRTILQREVRMSVSSGDRFGVIMLDIDHFKHINDHFGHTAGDSVLRQFAELLCTTIRAGDFIFRYGGEEFLVIVSSVDKDALQVVADKIISAIRRHRFKLLDETGHMITASLGVALHEGHPDFGRLIEQADAALLKAKEQGRNRWLLHDPAADPADTRKPNHAAP